MKDFSLENVGPYSGLIIAIAAMVPFFAAIFDADWLFSSDPKSFNIEKIDGWVTFFGRNTTRFIVGAISLFVIILSLVWFWYEFTHQKK